MSRFVMSDRQRGIMLALSPPGVELTHKELLKACVDPPKDLHHQLCRMQTAGWVEMQRWHGGNFCAYSLTDAGRATLMREQEHAARLADAASTTMRGDDR